MRVKVLDPKSCQTLVLSLLQNSDTLLHYCYNAVSKPQHKTIYALCKFSNLNSAMEKTSAQHIKSNSLGLGEWEGTWSQVSPCVLCWMALHQLISLCRHILTSPEATLSRVKDLKAVLLPYTSASRVKWRQNAMGMTVGINLQFTKHVCDLEALTLLRYHACLLITFIFAARPNQIPDSHN